MKRQHLPCEAVACPFCGAHDCRNDYIPNSPEPVKDEGWWYVQCEGCDALGPPAETPEQALEKWTTRTDVDSDHERKWDAWCEQRIEEGKLI